MRYQLDLTLRRAEGALVRVLGTTERRGFQPVIDGFAVNGSASVVGFTAGLVRKLQSGYLYHYAFAMILGLVALLALANHYWL